MGSWGRVGSAAAVLAVVVALLAGHGVSRAVADATCSDFPNQAAAQSYFLARGGPAADPDGLDADHDGIACESLRCPCSTATTSAPSPTPVATGTAAAPSATPAPTAAPPVPKATPTPAPSLGSSVPLAKVRRTSGCHVNGPLPDAACTPGARYSKVSEADVCVAGYAKRVRDVPASTKNAIYKAYGIAKHFNGTSGEVDHLVSLELGGSNDRANLFPEAATPRPGSHDKDKLENKLHALVCAGAVSLATAQRTIAKDWVKAYAKYVGTVPGQGR
jgi:hypothetical protein